MSAGYRSGQRGLTLIELLVAVSLLAIIGLLGYRGLDSVRLSTGHVSQQSERHQQLAMSLARIGRDIANIVGAGSEVPSLPTASSSELSFLRVSSGGMPPRRVGYRWQAETGSLLLAGWPDIDAPDVRAQVLLADVKSMRIAYLDINGNWLDQWPATAVSLPRAFRVSLELPDLGHFERIFDVPAAD